VRVPGTFPSGDILEDFRYLLNNPLLSNPIRSQTREYNVVVRNADGRIQFGAFPRCCSNRAPFESE
jgi:hypothetical protein